jgi:hypothetical protein
MHNHHSCAINAAYTSRSLCAKSRIRTNRHGNSKHHQVCHPINAPHACIMRELLVSPDISTDIARSPTPPWFRYGVLSHADRSCCPNPQQASATLYLVSLDPREHRLQSSDRHLSASGGPCPGPTNSPHIDESTSQVKPLRFRARLRYASVKHEH